MNNSGFTQAELQQMQAFLKTEIFILNLTKLNYLVVAKKFTKEKKLTDRTYKLASNTQKKINKLAKLQYKVKKLQKTQ